MDISGKTIVLTGASRGIGRALAKELAKYKCRLLLTALESDELAALFEELSVLPAKTLKLSSDLTSFEERQSLIEWIKNMRNPPDILVNNAGMGGIFGRFINQDWKEIEKIVSLNTMAMLHLTRELLPILRSRPQAKIVNINSGIARLPYPGLAVYGATKGFIASFSESLACELSESNVSVLCFHPAFTHSHFMESSKMDMQKVPKMFIHSPQEIAIGIIKAIRKDKRWGFSDFSTAVSTRIGQLLPHRFKTCIFKNLFWRLPDEK